MSVSDIRDNGASQAAGFDNSPIIQSVAMNTGVAVIPPGDWPVRTPITTSGRPIQIVGAGKYESRLVLSAPNDLFRHQHDAPNASIPLVAPFAIRGLSLTSAAIGAGICLNIKQNTDYGHFDLEDVAFNAFGAQYNWNKFGLFKGTTLTKFKNVEASGGSYEDDGTAEFLKATIVGFDFVAEDAYTKIYDVNFDGCNLDAAMHVIRCTMSSDGTIEGVRLSKTNGRTVNGAYLRIQINRTDGWMPPYYTLHQCNMEGPGQLLNFDAVSEFHMSECLHYIDAGYTQQTGNNAGMNTPLTDYMNLGRARNVWLRDNSVTAFANSKATTFVSVKGDSGHPSSGITHRDNFYNVQGYTPPNGPITFAAFASSAPSGQTRSSGNIYDMDSRITREVFAA